MVDNKNYPLPWKSSLLLSFQTYAVEKKTVFAAGISGICGSNAAILPWNAATHMVTFGN